MLDIPVGERRFGFYRFAVAVVVTGIEIIE